MVFALFLVWVWARYIQIGVRGGGILGTVRFEFVVGFVLIMLCTWVLMMKPLEVTRSRNIVLGITLLFVVMLVQIPFAAVPQHAKNIFVDRVIKFAFLTFFMAALVRSPKNMRFFIAVFLIAAFWITQEAVRGLVSGALVWQNQGVNRLHGAVPIYAHPNSLGGVAMGTIPFVVFLWPVWKKIWQRLGLLAVCTTSIICVIFSGSRTSYVAFLAFVVFWFVKSRKKLRFIVIGAVVAPLIYVLLPAEYIERFDSIGDHGGSETARLQIMQDAWDIFLSQPIGIGLGCFPIVRAQRFGRSQDTHNLYLEIVTNMGVQGFVVFVAFVAAVMYGFQTAASKFGQQRDLLARSSPRRGLDRVRLRLLRQHIEDLDFLGAVANAGAGFIFVRLVLGFFGMDMYEVYWWFGAGLAISLVELVDRTDQRTKAIRHVPEVRGDQDGQRKGDGSDCRHTGRLQ